MNCPCISWLGKQVSLCQLTAYVPEQLHVLLPLHSFGNYLEAQAVRQRHLAAVYELRGDREGAYFVASFAFAPGWCSQNCQTRCS